MSTNFVPPSLLNNEHLQTIVSSIGLRRALLTRRATELRQSSEEVLIECSDGERLQGFYNPVVNAKSLVIMIHGWEGSHDSNYMLSCGRALRDAGHSLFRLNLRDHGTSHALNSELFNSTRLQEVVSAVEVIQKRFSHQHYGLIGYSLGGNFALRVAAQQSQRQFRLDQCIAVCPPISPANSMLFLEQGAWVYRWYFVRKWQKSLRIKLTHFPELNYQDALLKLKSLRDMNGFFVPNFTPFEEPAQYFDGYSIHADRLAGIACPTTIFSAADDPVVPTEDLELIDAHPLVDIAITQHGGHCGYLKNLRLDSWIDDQALRIFGSLL